MNSEPQCSCRYCKDDHDKLVTLIATFEAFRPSNELRMEKLNELRAQLEIDRKFYMRIDVYEVQHAQINRRVDDLRDAIERLTNRQAWIIGGATVAALFFGVIGATVKHLFQ